MRAIASDRTAHEGIGLAKYFASACQRHALAKNLANPKPEQPHPTNQTGNDNPKENDTDLFRLGLGKQPAFMRYGGSRERAPQNPLFVCASAWLCIPEMSGRIKNSVGPVGLKTVLMTVVTTGLLTVTILCMLLLKNSLAFTHYTEPLDVLAY